MYSSDSHCSLVLQISVTGDGGCRMTNYCQFIQTANQLPMTCLLAYDVGAKQQAKTLVERIYAHADDMDCSASRPVPSAVWKCVTTAKSPVM